MDSGFHRNDVAFLKSCLTIRNRLQGAHHEDPEPPPHRRRWHADPLCRDAEQGRTDDPGIPDHALHRRQQRRGFGVVDVQSGRQGCGAAGDRARRQPDATRAVQPRHLARRPVAMGRTQRPEQLLDRHRTRQCRQAGTRRQPLDFGGEQARLRRRRRARRQPQARPPRNAADRLARVQRGATRSRRTGRAIADGKILAEGRARA